MKSMDAILVIFLIAASQCLGAEPPAASPSDPEKTARQLLTPQAEQAIQRGLAWMVSHQHDDGSFGYGTYEGNTAVTGLAGMALMSAGSTPGRGPYGHAIDRAVSYVLANAQESGFINAQRGAGHGPMYGHGFATMFLAECYGMSSRPELRDVLNRAVKLIINTQNKEGGWRYFPLRADADISVTVCQVMALRAARNAGIYVPKETVDRAVEYIRHCQNPDGGFRYMRQNTSEQESRFPRSAGAITALNSAGIYQGTEIHRGMDYLMRFLPGPHVDAVQRETYYEYGQYYAVQAMWQAGGDTWNRWFPAARDEIISRQQPDGSWASNNSVEAGTAMCLMVLLVPNNMLPIFQR